MGFELYDDEIDDGCSENESADDAASFPTQEDLESIIVHAPESLADIEARSVSSTDYVLGHNLSVRSGSSAPGSVGSGKDRVTFFGGGSSVGGLSEKSSDAKVYNISYLSDSERPSKVAISRSAHFQFVENVSIAGIESISMRASSVKSDVATVFSGSAVEDIELASVGTAHSGGHAFSTTSSFSMENGSKPKGSIECAYEISTRLYSDPPLKKSSDILSSAPKNFGLASLESSGVNDMGPPVRRYLLEPVGNMESQTGSVRSIDCSPGTPPRAGSLRSFGSQAASEAVNNDIDDFGSENNSIHGLDENRSHSPNYDISSNREGFGMDASAHLLNDEETIRGVISLHERQSNSSNGRISPGGTVYKGRGVRRYQGRYMNLPLTRFHQNQLNHCTSRVSENVEGTIIHMGLSHSDIFESVRSLSRSGSHSFVDRRPSRSRSRSRDRNRGRSTSPKDDEVQNVHHGYRRINQNSNSGRSWRNNNTDRYGSYRHPRQGRRRGRW